MYEYLPGPDSLGIGTENLGFVRPTTLPIDSIYSPRYNVRQTLDLHSNGALKTAQQFVPVSLLANGLYFSGTLELQALVEFEKARNNQKA